MITLAIHMAIPIVANSGDKVTLNHGAIPSDDTGSVVATRTPLSLTYCILKSEMKLRLKPSGLQ